MPILWPGQVELSVDLDFGGWQRIKLVGKSFALGHPPDFPSGEFRERGAEEDGGGGDALGELVGAGARSARLPEQQGAGRAGQQTRGNGGEPLWVARIVADQAVHHHADRDNAAYQRGDGRQPLLLERAVMMLDVEGGALACGGFEPVGLGLRFRGVLGDRSAQLLDADTRAARVEELQRGRVGSAQSSRTRRQ